MVEKSYYLTSNKWKDYYKIKKWNRNKILEYIKEKSNFDNKHDEYEVLSFKNFYHVNLDDKRFIIEDNNKTLTNLYYESFEELENFLNLFVFK